jgi:hypothetical protein
MSNFRGSAVNPAVALVPKLTARRWLDLFSWQSTHKTLNSIHIAKVKAPRELQLAVTTASHEMYSPLGQLASYAPNEVGQAHTYLERDRCGSRLVLAGEVKRRPRCRRGASVAQPASPLCAPGGSKLFVNRPLRPRVERACRVGANLDDWDAIELYFFHFNSVSA